MITTKPTLDDVEPEEADAFTASLAPVNRTHPFPFRLREKLCCFGLMVTAMTLLRLLLAN